MHVCMYVCMYIYIYGYSQKKSDEIWSFFSELVFQQQPWERSIRFQATISVAV